MSILPIRNTFIIISSWHAFSSQCVFILLKIRLNEISLSKIGNEPLEQRGLNQNQSVTLFTLVEGCPTKVTNAWHFDESGKTTRRIHGTPLSRDESMDQVTIQRPSIDRVYAEFRNPYFFSGPEVRQKLLDDIATASMKVWNSRKLVREDGETGSQSWKSHTNVDAVGTDLTVSVAAVPSNVNPVESETTAATSISEGSMNATKPMEVFDNTLNEKI